MVARVVSPETYGRCEHNCGGPDHFIPPSEAPAVRQLQYTTFPDSITGEPRRPRQCYVVTSGQISEPARNAIAATLGSRMEAVRLIDGKELWRLVKEHLKGAAFKQAVEDIRKATDEASPNWTIVTSIDGEMTTLSPKAKHPRAAELEPLELHGSFAFPDTPEGQAAFAEFRKHVETGAPVKLGPPVEIDLTVPEFLRPLLNTERPGSYEIHLGPRVGTEAVHLRLSMRPKSGVEVAHDRVMFRVVQLGTEEVTLESDPPWRFGLVFNKKGPRQLTYSASYKGTNVRLAAQAAKFEHALGQGGELRIYDADSALLHGATSVPSGTELDQLTFLDAWIRLLDALVLVQATTGISLTVPDGDITSAEAERAFLVARIVSEGVRQIDASGVTTKISNLTLEGAKLLLEAGTSSNNGLVFRGEREETTTLFGTAIPLGPVAVLATRYRRTQATRERLQAFLNRGKPGGDLELELEPGDGASAQIVYTNWAPEDLRRGLPLPNDPKPEPQ